MKKNLINLRLFEDGANGTGAEEGAGNSNNKGTYSFEQAEEIANARAQKAERAALANYFRSQGMTEEEITSAITDFKAKKQASQPNVDAITKERDAYKAQIAQMNNEKYLSSKGVKAEDVDYVSFKIGQKVDDKTDFKKAADSFLKENPRFTASAYRVSTSVQSGGNGRIEDTNDSINAAIRRAAGR